MDLEPLRNGRPVDALDPNTLRFRQCKGITNAVLNIRLIDFNTKVIYPLNFVGTFFINFSTSIGGSVLAGVAKIILSIVIVLIVISFVGQID